MTKKIIIGTAALFALASASMAMQDRSMPNRTKNTDHMGAFCFVVEISGIAIGTFSQVEDFEENTEIIEVDDGDGVGLRKRPGRKKFGDILIKPVVGNTDLERWREEAQAGMAERRSLDVKLKPGCSVGWPYSSFPAKWKITGFADDNSSNVSTEEISMSVESMEIR